MRPVSLILVHHHELVAILDAFARRGAAVKQADRFDQRASKSSALASISRVLIAFIDARQSACSGFSGVLGRCRPASASGRTGCGWRARLYELIVQAKRFLVCGLDNTELVVGIVDRKQRSEAPRRTCPNGAPSFRSNRTRKEWKVARVGIDSLARPGLASMSRERTRSRISPAALLVKVTAKIPHPGTRWAVIKWAIRRVITRGFATTGPGQNKEGTFRMLGGLTLAGVEALQEIHEETILTWGRNRQTIESR